jgi:predicted DNA-binding transcriptional regulator YafY
MLSTLPKEMVNNLNLDQENINEEIVLEVLLKISQSLGKVFYKQSQSLIQQAHDYKTIFTKIDFEDMSEHIDALKILESAILQKSIILFSYNNYDFAIEPYKIISFDGYWYLLGNDTSKNKIKKFKIHNIQNPTFSKQKFIHDETINDRLNNAINVWFDPSKEAYPIELLVDEEIKHYLINRPINNTQRVTENGDGSITLHLTITNNMEIIPLIGYWTPHIKVITPEHLYQAVVQRISPLIRDYEII